nr:MAG TPA: hypothetical protein [Crassvirales sp.]
MTFFITSFYKDTMNILSSYYMPVIISIIIKYFSRKFTQNSFQIISFSFSFKKPDHLSSSKLWTCLSQRIKVICK